MEQSLADLMLEERYTKWPEMEEPVLVALLAWANKASDQILLKSILDKALHYLWEQWPCLVRYLEDERLELSNNRAKRSIKPLVMDPKNWLISNTPAGTQYSAVNYSLIDTTKENDLNPYHLLGLAPAQRTWAKPDG